MTERHILVDPYVLAVPNDPAQAEAYIHGLATWLPSLAQSRDECSCFEAVLPILMQEGRFPTHDTLKPVLARANTIEFSIVDLLRMVGLLAATEPYFEHFIDRRSATGQVTIAPPQSVTRLGATLEAATSDTLRLVAVAHDAGWCPERTYWATSTWDGDHVWIDVTAHVELVERHDGTIEELNRDVAAKLKVLTAVDQVEFSQSVLDLYREPEKAAAALLRRLKQYDSGLPDSVPLTAGDTFIKSIEAANLHHQPAILETVYERAVFASLGTLGNIAGAHLHPVRTNSAADAPQVERADGAKLWRCMVTKSGAGYRLHYWRLSNGVIELDEVLVESEV